MNSYQKAILRIIELEDLYANRQAEANLYKGMSVGLGNQLRDTFALLKEARDLLAVVMDTDIHDDIQELIAEIDKFYQRGE